MTMSTTNKTTITRVAALSDSLDVLEAKLDVLFARTLPETIVTLDTLEQAKLQVALPYLINDLIFIYLRTRGIDPKTHPVVHELDRVRQYFGKIAVAEDPQKKRTELDKAAATRFIKHAIAQSKNGPSLAPDAALAKPNNTGINFEGQPQASTSTRVPLRVTSKMKERLRYERELKEMGDDEEDDDLEVFDDSRDRVDVVEVVKDNLRDEKGKSKAVRTDRATVTAKETRLSSGKKRRRQAMDPFGEIDQETKAVDDVRLSETPTKKTKKIVETDGSNLTSVNPSPVPDADATTADKPKKRKKKKGKGRESKDVESD